MRIALPALLALLIGTTPLAAQAWWNADWSQRTRLTLDTSAKGLETREAVAAMPLAIRLHAGNFDFVVARPDGSDLRVLAADDKTVLAHRIERFDASNELAVLWVQLPTVLAGSDKNTVHVYAGNDKAPAAAAPGQAMDAATLLAVHFDDAGKQGADSVGSTRTVTPLAPEPAALLAGGAKLDGKPLVWPASDKLRIEAGGALTVSLWLRPDAAASGTLLAWGPLQILLAADGKASAKVGGKDVASALAGASLAPTAWSHLALVLGGGKARLVINGAEAATADLATPAVAGELRVGGGLRGAVDELQVANTARSADWLALAVASQGPSDKLVRSAKEGPDSGSADGGGQQGYMGILVKNLTTDAWVVIIILGLMFVLALVVMATKLRYIIRADRDNRKFQQRFRSAKADLLKLDPQAKHAESPLFRLYAAGQRELKKRHIGEPGAQALSAASLNAVKASVDADLVRESHRLNAHMVWLTIAISGGPFLGLLGTVVGVMITFAAIAAAGDVNVNAIAPGIAAALLATVAGLAVAIPALFGYNYLASRIKNLSADMQIFVDEFVTRVAEEFGN